MHPTQTETHAVALFTQICHYRTPDDRHTHRDVAILAQRDQVFRAARAAHPECWSGETRNWTRIDTLRLAPKHRPTEGLQPAVV